MPVVTKQTKAGPAPKGKVSIIQRIIPVAEVQGGITMGVYGRSGTGKTRFIATWPKPLLILGAEKGIKSIKTTPQVDWVPVTSADEAGELIDHARKTRKWRSVSLDTGTMLQAHALRAQLKLEDLIVQNSWGMATRDDYGQVAIVVKEVLRALLGLAEVNINVVVTTQEKVHGSPEDEDSEPSDVIVPQVGCDLQRSVAAWFHPAVDNLAGTFIRKGLKEKKIPMAGGKFKTTYVPTGKMEFCLRVGPNPTYLTKFRVPEGEFPECIVDPTFDKLKKYMDPS